MLGDCVPKYLDAAGVRLPHRYFCDVCEETFESSRPAEKSHEIHRRCGKHRRQASKEPPCTGACPGDEYKLLTDTLGLQAKAGCQCEAIQRDMNRLSMTGCVEKRAELVARLQANYAAHYSYRDLFVAAQHAEKKEALRLLWKLRTLDANTAIERLFDLAVENARAKVIVTINRPGD